MALKSLTEAVVHDAGHKLPIRRVIGQSIDGPIVEKRAHIAALKWVDRKGNVRHAPMATGSALREVDCTKYARDRKMQIEASGGIMYGDCPIRTGSLDEGEFPEEMRLVCRKGSYGERRACEHVEYVIAARQGRSIKQDQLRHEARNRKRLDEQRRQETQEAVLSKLVDVVENMQGGQPKRKKQPVPKATVASGGEDVGESLVEPEGER